MLRLVYTTTRIGVKTLQDFTVRRASVFGVICTDVSGRFGVPKKRLATRRRVVQITIKYVNKISRR